VTAPRRNRNFVALLLLAVATPLGAQTGQTPASPAGQLPAQSQSDSQTQTQGANAGQDNVAQDNAGLNQTPNSGDEERATVPLSLDMAAGSLDFSQEATRKNYLEGGVSVGATYDNNLLSSGAPTIGGFTYSVLPNLSLQIGRRRLAWGITYAGGYVANQKYSAYNQSSHNAAFDLQYRLSRHVTLTLHDRFSRIPHLVDQLPDNATTNGVGAIQQPNQAVIAPLTLEQDNTGTAQISYQYSASDIVGAGATSYMTQFGKPPVGSTTVLFDTQSYEGDGFYSHRFTPRNWGGVTYSFARLSFSPGAETFDSHSILLLYTIYLRPRMQVAFFAGPEYSSLNTEIITTVVTPPTVSVTAVPSSDQRWSASGGGSFSWQGSRTSVNASASHKTSDGGGLVGAVELITGSLGVRRQITRFATLEVDAVYGDSRSLDQAASNFRELNSATASVIWTQHLSRGFVARLGYAQEYQKEETQLPPALDIKHSRGWFTIGYEFGKSLGR
jgi:hypothetical protein